MHYVRERDEERYTVLMSTAREHTACDVRPMKEVRGHKVTLDENDAI